VETSYLNKKVIMEIDNKGLFPLSRRERKLIKDFPDLREESDYDLIEIPGEKLHIYIKLMKRFFREVKILLNIITKTDLLKKAQECINAIPELKGHVKLDLLEEDPGANLNLLVITGTALNLLQ